MISTVLVFVAVQSAKPEITAAKAISNMFQRYHSAQTLSGTIKSEVSDGAGKITFTTQVAYERPSKIFVTQDRKGRNGLELMLVSDGERFAYDPPRTTPVQPKPFERLYEPVLVRNVSGSNWSHKIGDIYAVGHSSLEYCVSLDLVIAHDVHLLEFKNQLAKFELAGIEEFYGQKAYKIVGDWRASKNVDPSARVTIYIGMEFDLLGFSLKEKYAIGGKIVDFQQTEVCDIRVGASSPADLFRVR